MPKHLEDLGTQFEADIYPKGPEASLLPTGQVEVYVGAGNKLCPDLASVHSGYLGLQTELVVISVFEYIIVKCITRQLAKHWVLAL